MGKFYTPAPRALALKPVGIKTKAYVKKRNGVSRIVTNSYGKPSDWWDLCKQVRKRDKHRCLFCGKLEDSKNRVYHEVHHIKRLADGGTTTLANLCLCCKDCHVKRPGHSHMLGRK